MSFSFVRAAVTKTSRVLAASRGLNEVDFGNEVGGWIRQISELLS
jgi:hypothetical protein